MCFANIIGLRNSVRTGKIEEWPFGQKSHSPTLTEQLDKLSDCGIRLRSGIDQGYVLALHQAIDYQDDPYRLLLSALGAEIDTPPFYTVSPNIWYFDVECVEDNGSYAAIARHMCDLAQGDLQLEQITDSVDVDEPVGWLAFALHGQAYRWEVKIDEDWVDPAVLSKFADLLNREETGRRFTYCDLGEAQDCLIGCATDTQRNCLNGVTGMEFKWLG